MAFDFGPWTWRGEASGSVIFTRMPEWYATPFAQRGMSLSARAIQKRFSSLRNRTGSVRVPAILVRDEDVLPLAHLALPHVPRGQELHELESVGSADLDVALDGHIPQSDVLEEMPVLRDGIRVVAREGRVVVDRV